MWGAVCIFLYLVFTQLLYIVVRYLSNMCSALKRLKTWSAVWKARHHENELEANKWMKLLLPFTNPNLTPDPCSNFRDGEALRWWPLQLEDRYKRCYQTSTNFFLGHYSCTVVPVVLFFAPVRHHKCQWLGHKIHGLRKNCHFRPIFRYILYKKGTWLLQIAISKS